MSENIIQQDEIDYYTALQDIIDYFDSIPDNIAGGTLHLVFDDGNYDHRSLRFCLELAVKQEDYLGAYIAKELLKFPEDKLEGILKYGVIDAFIDK